MAFREVELPDGTIAEFPDTMSDDAVAAVLRKQYAPKPTDLRSKVSEAVGPLGSGILRGVAQLPEAALQAGSLLAAPYTGVAPSQLEQYAKSTPAGQTLFEAGQPQTDIEKQYKEQAPVQSFVGEIAPTMAIAPQSALKNAPALEKAGTAALQGLIGSQTSAYQSPEQRVQGAGIGAGGGALLERGLAGVGALASPLTKYMPFVDKRKAAAVEIAKNRGGKMPASAKAEQAMYKQVESTLGKEYADTLSLAQMTGDERMLNMEKAYAQAQTPEGAAMIQQAANRKQAAQQQAIQEYRNTIKLSDKESEVLDQLQNKLLPETKMAPDSVAKLTTDPIIKNFLRSVGPRPKGGKPSEEAMLFQARVGEHALDTAYYFDVVRRKLMEKKVAYDEAGEYSNSDLYKTAISKLDEELGKSTGGKYQTMKALQQRQIITRELDDEFANVAKEFSEGKSVQSYGDVLKIFRGNRLKEQAMEIARMKDDRVRGKAERGLNLIQHIVGRSDPREIAKQLGREQVAYPQVGGVVSTTAREVGTFMRGGYNKEVAYLLANPEKYIQQLEAIEKVKPAERLPKFAVLLGSLQAEE